MKNKKTIILSSIILLIIIGIALAIVFHPSQESIPENKVKEQIESTVPSSTTDIDENKLEKEGFQESNPEFVASIPEEKFIVGTKQSQPVYYSQIDGRWTNHPYTSVGNPSQTIGSSGCGPTSAAMVVSTIKGVITPPQMGDLFVNNGFRTADNGTYFSAFPWVASYFDIDYVRVNSTYEMAEKVQEGYIAIVSCSDGLFTTGGHFITVVDIAGDTLEVFDPYLYNGKFNIPSRVGKVTVSGNSVLCSVSNFKAYANAKAFFCYKYKEGSEPTPVPVPTPSDVEFKYVTANSGLNVRNAPAGDIVDALPKGTKVAVYSYSGIWANIGTDRWVSSEYLSDQTQQEQSTSLVGYTTAKSGLRIRTSPNGTIIGSYSYNTRVEIIGETDGWYKTNKGYISKQYVSTSQQSSKQSTSFKLGRYITKVSTKLNVRKSNSTSSAIVKQYSNNTVFDTYQIKGEWAQTPSGWVNLNYAQLLYQY